MAKKGLIVDDRERKKLFSIFFFLFSILSQILRVNDDVLDFRQSIATLFEQSCDQDNNVSSDVVTPEDPLHPSIAIRTSARDVSPKELRRSPAAFFFANPSPDDMLVRNISAEIKPKNDQITCNGTKSNSELPTVAQCDNLSAISMGVSSSSSESVILLLFIIIAQKLAFLKEHKEPLFLWTDVHVHIASAFCMHLLLAIIFFRKKSCLMTTMFPLIYRRVTVSSMAKPAPILPCPYLQLPAKFAVS